MKKRIIPQQEPEVAQLMKEIGERITEARQKIEPNYKNFASKYDINNMTLWRMEKGEDYKMSSFLQILKKVNVNPEDFFKGILW